MCDAMQVEDLEYERYSFCIPDRSMGHFVLSAKRDETVGTLKRKILQLESWQERPKSDFIMLLKVTEPIS